MQKYVRIRTLAETKATDDYIVLILERRHTGQQYVAISPDAARDAALRLLDAAAAFAAK